MCPPDAQSQWQGACINAVKRTASGGHLEAADLAAALDIARQVARESASMLAASRDVGCVRTKTSAKDLVTEWDVRSDEQIARRLEALTPSIGRLAEESGASGAFDSELRWVIDPLDGTVNFSQRLPYWSVTISLELRGQPVVGVVHAPVLGWEYWASEGNGAFRNGERIRVSSVSQLRQATLITGFPYNRGTAQRANFREWEYFQRATGACRRFGCASVDMALVSDGRCDGYWEAGVKAWDISAGALLVQEAGGRVTSLTGGRFMSETGQAIASNGFIHNEMIEGLREAERNYHTDYQGPSRAE